MKAYTLILAVVAASNVLHANEYAPQIRGMQILRLTTDTKAKFDFVQKYQDMSGFDFLKLPRNTSLPIEVLVTADRLDGFKRSLRANRIPFDVTVNDMGKVIEREFVSQRAASIHSRIESPSNISLTYYPRYDEIVSYLQQVAKIYSDRVELFSIGNSSEGREIVGVKFSSGGNDKPALLIDAGIHAREWIAPTTALYAIKQLAENASNSYLFKDIDIYIIPLINPDGYEYTHESPSTRLWRKTRSTHPYSTCRGADPNRNFGYQWLLIGASLDPCNQRQIFAGRQPFSEPEAAALRDFILPRKGLIKVYLTLHSFGGYFLYPWGYDKDPPANEPSLKCVAKKAVAALTEVRGTRYKIGSSAALLYPAAGGSDDWAIAKGGVDLAYTIELPGPSFTLPPNEIIPVGQETFEAFKVVTRYVANTTCETL